MGICCGKAEGTHSRKPGPKAARSDFGEEKQHAPSAVLNGGTHANIAPTKRAPLQPLQPHLSNANGDAASHRHLSTNLSLFCEDDYHSCKDDFSVIDALSPRHSGCGSLELHAEHAQGGTSNAVRGSTTSPSSRPPARAHVDHGTTTASPFFTAQQPAASTSLGEQRPGVPVERDDDSSSRPVGCLNIIEVLSARLHTSAVPNPEADQHPANGAKSKGRRTETPSAPDSMPSCGVSLSRRDMSKSADEVSMCYEDGDGRHYNIRGIDYMKTKVKVHSDKSMYKLAAADMFTFDRKQNHIAKLVKLPNAPAAVHQMSPSSSACYPPVLIINLQLPTYAPSFFGGTDGPGWSIVYYFTLPEDFDPAAFPNKKALGLFRRFVQNGKEADGSATRDRFKIVPRVVNVDEWAQTGPLSTAEHKLLSGYNEKPVLSRPQHKFFHEANYFEVDLDIHTYSYMARTALMSFMSRLKSIIFEIAFVIQGNSVDELPEQVLGCGRIYRSDFGGQRPFNSFLPREPESHAEPDGAEPKA